MLGFSPLGSGPIGASSVAASTGGAGAVSSDLACSYAVRAAVSSDLACSYAVRSSVSSDLAAGFSVRQSVLSDLACSYVVRASVSSDLSCSFTVLAPSLTPVSSDLACAYNVRASVSSDLACSFSVEAFVEYTRAPGGCGYYGQLPVAPDTVKRIGQVVPAVSLETARLGARLDGDVLDTELMSFAGAFTMDAEHETQRCFINQRLRATWDSFPAALQLRFAPLSSVTAVKFYDQSGVLRTLDPQDYVVDADSEPAYLVPAAGKAWPQTMPRPGAVVVEYVSGYGLDENSVPSAARMYVLARLQQQYSPVANAKPENFDRLLDSLRVYA